MSVTYRVAWVTIDRAEARNALSAQVRAGAAFRDKRAPVWKGR